MAYAQNAFQRETHGIRITVRPVYADEHSNPELGQYVFVYHITIENLGEWTAQLLRRHWFIRDPVAGDSEVQGEGVVGDQPVLAPGDDYEYQSFCVLRGPEGYMEGYYHFRRPGGEEFEAEIPRFELQAHA